MNSRDSPKIDEDFIINKLSQYFTIHPTPTKIQILPNAFKLTQTLICPCTYSQNFKQSFVLNGSIQFAKKMQITKKKMAYDSSKMYISEVGTCDSISTKDKHDIILEDEIFGPPNMSNNGLRWVYIAKIKEQETKSVFLNGKGKLPYKHDFGQRYDDLRETGIFLWDKKIKKIVRICINKDLIPAHVSFANKEGSQILFHAYQRQHFGHGLYYSFNRKTKIYRGKILQEIQSHQNISSCSFNIEIKDLFPDDTNQTQMYPKISPCLNYLVYLSGTGHIHTFYMDFVICKYINNQWKQIYRLKQQFIGYNLTLRPFVTYFNGKAYALVQGIQRSCVNIYRVELQTGNILNLTQKFSNYSFSIDEVHQNIVAGTVSTNNFNTFFWIKETQIHIIDPHYRQKFLEEEYQDPIHSLLVSAKEEDVWPEYKNRLEKRPMIVMPHGGPHGSFLNYLNPFRYMLLKMGYYCLYPNFTGSAGYGKQYLQGSLGQIGNKNAEEIIQTIKRVLEYKQNIDRDQIHIQGISYGGYMGSLCASRYFQHFKSAIIVNGVINLVSMLWFSDIPQWVSKQALGRNFFEVINKNDYSCFWQKSVITHPLKIPVLQLLGAKDRNLPFQQGLFLDAITKQQGGSITTYVYEDSGHSLNGSTETIIDSTVKMLLFLEQNNSNVSVMFE